MSAVPDRYLSVTDDPRDTDCTACNGVGCYRAGPGDYHPCPDCAGVGRTTPRGEFPRLWAVVDGALPVCATTPDRAVAVSTFYRPWAPVAWPRPATPRPDDPPVWDGTAGTFRRLSDYP